MSETNKMSRDRSELFKKLLKILSESINTTMQESESIGEAVAIFKANGFNIVLTVELTILFEDTSSNNDQDDQATTSPVEIKITHRDSKFLKALKISTDDIPKA